MITLYAFGPFFGCTDASPFVSKALVHLTLSKLDFQIDYEGYPSAPKGRLPYIKDGDQIIADSVFIREHLETAHNVDFNAHLSPEQRAQAWAIERMIDDHLYWGVLYYRWMLPENFKKGPALFFEHFPEDQRQAMIDATMEDLQSRLKGQGLGLHNQDELTQHVLHSIQALSDLLGDKSYMFGEQPSAVDASAYGIIDAILSPVFDTPLRRKVESLPNLISYRDRIRVDILKDETATSAELEPVG